MGSLLGWLKTNISNERGGTRGQADWTNLYLQMRMTSGSVQWNRAVELGVNL
jgi:hypothetical protein